MDRTRLRHFTYTNPITAREPVLGKAILVAGQNTLAPWLASTFLDLLCSQVPEIILSINEALADNELEAAYRFLPSIDLSRDILAVQPHRLLAVADKTSGWADLGSPRRVMDILARNNIQPAWLRDGISLSEVFGLSAGDARRGCRSGRR
jgi:hypothetical protein